MSTLLVDKIQTYVEISDRDYLPVSQHVSNSGIVMRWKGTSNR